MAKYEDRVLHDIDGIEEYDNPLPGWLMAIWWGSLIFAVVYIGFYALSFGDGGSMDAEYRAEATEQSKQVEAYFAAHPVVPPSAEELLAGAQNTELLAKARAKFQEKCVRCHGAQAQGAVGPNLTDDHWLHGGRVLDIFRTITKGVDGKGMPKFGRELDRDEIAMLVSFIRSIQGSKPANPKPPEGKVAAPEPLPGG